MRQLEAFDLNQANKHLVFKVNQINHFLRWNIAVMQPSEPTIILSRPLLLLSGMLLMLSIASKFSQGSFMLITLWSNYWGWWIRVRVNYIWTNWNWITTTNPNIYYFCLIRSNSSHWFWCINMRRWINTWIIIWSSIDIRRRVRRCESKVCWTWIHWHSSCL